MDNEKNGGEAGVAPRPIDAVLLSLGEDALRDWVGSKTAARAMGYRANVGPVYCLPDGFASHVQGSELYTTNVYVDGFGAIASVCSCPVGVNCKHGAALALVASEMLREGREVPRLGGEELELDRDEVRARLRGRGRGPQAGGDHGQSRFNAFAPIPRNGPDFSRAYDGGPISFPGNRFKTSMWPGICCHTAEDVRNTLSIAPT